MESPSKTLAERLVEIKNLEEDIVKQAGENFPVNMAIFATDLYIFGALNRLLAQARGFRSMLNESNFQCAGALIRMQLDIALRVSAMALIDNRDFVCDQILNGGKLSDHKDRTGKKLTDTYLIKQLLPKWPWVESVYQSTSEFIHLSGRHVFAVTSDVNDDGMMQLAISGVDQPCDEVEYYEAVEEFFQTTKLAGLQCLGYLKWRISSDPRGKNLPASNTP